MTPQRIQRKRKKGWRMPPNTVYVGRPTKWGNPYPIAKYGPTEAMRRYTMRLLTMSAAEQIELLRPLEGKDLACWCPEDAPCHADILLRMANRGGDNT